MGNKHILLLTLLGIALAVTGAVPALAQEDKPPTAFASISGNYLEIQASLAADSLAGIKDNALAIARLGETLDRKFDPRLAGVAEKNAAATHELMPELARSAEALAKATDLTAARSAFADLSEALVLYRAMIIGSDKPNVAYCPMAKHNWLQSGQEIANPYYGTRMLRCGSIVDK